MSTLSERLEIRLSSETMAMLRRQADARHTSIAQLVRETIEQALRNDREERRKAAEALCSLELPVSHWDEMEKEIETTYWADAHESDLR